MKKPSKAIKYDDDAPLTDEELRSARSLRDRPEMRKAIKHALRGRPSGTARKMPVTISLDKDIVAMLRKSGGGWQTRLNELLRSMMGLLT